MVTDEQDPAYFEFASRVLGNSLRHEDGCRVLTSLDSEGLIAAVAVFSDFNGTNMEISIASNGTGHWVTRKYLRMVFGYPFKQLGVRRLTGIVDSTNERALKLNRHLGFVVEGRLRKWFGENDGIVMGMLSEECRWI